MTLPCLLLVQARNAGAGVLSFQLHMCRAGQVPTLIRDRSAFRSPDLRPAKPPDAAKVPQWSLDATSVSVGGSTGAASGRMTPDAGPHSSAGSTALYSPMHPSATHFQPPTPDRVPPADHFPVLTRAAPTVAREPAKTLPPLPLDRGHSGGPGPQFVPGPSGHYPYPPPPMSPFASPPRVRPEHGGGHSGAYEHRPFVPGASHGRPMPLQHPMPYPHMAFRHEAGLPEFPQRFQSSVFLSPPLPYAPPASVSVEPDQLAELVARGTQLQAPPAPSPSGSAGVSLRPPPQRMSFAQVLKGRPAPPPSTPSGPASAARPHKR